MTPRELEKWAVDNGFGGYFAKGGLIAPSPGDVHVNTPLTNISIAYMQAEAMFVANRIFPMVPVMKRSDVYYTFDRDDWLRDEMQERAPGTESSGSGYKVATENYMTRVYAHHKDIDDQTRANADMQVRLDANATRFVTQKGLIQRERRFAAVALQDDVWNYKVMGQAAPGNLGVNLFSDTASELTDATIQQWSQSTSNPIEDIKTMKRAVQVRTSFRPNVLVIGRSAYDVLTEHPDILDRMNRGQTRGNVMANMQDLMQLFELDDIVIMDAIYNTDGPSLGATPLTSYNFVNDDDALLLYRPSQPGLEVPSAGYMFAWTGLVGGSNGMRVKRFRMEQIESSRIELQQAYDFKVTGADLAVWMEDIV
ncbi:MAG: major capsid protein [Alphaproteobacteria bacterium]|nr:major capsid protein [Alphaproteobacteria bacterium]